MFALWKKAKNSLKTLFENKRKKRALEEIEWAAIAVEFPSRARWLRASARLDDAKRATRRWQQERSLHPGRESETFMASLDRKVDDCLKKRAAAEKELIVAHEAMELEECANQGRAALARIAPNIHVQEKRRAKRI